MYPQLLLYLEACTTPSWGLPCWDIGLLLPFRGAGKMLPWQPELWLSAHCSVPTLALWVPSASPPPIQGLPRWRPQYYLIHLHLLAPQQPGPPCAIPPLTLA